MHCNHSAGSSDLDTDTLICYYGRAGRCISISEGSSVMENVFMDVWSRDFIVHFIGPLYGPIESRPGIESWILSACKHQIDRHEPCADRFSRLSFCICSILPSAVTPIVFHWTHPVLLTFSIRPEIVHTLCISVRACEAR